MLEEVGLAERAGDKFRTYSLGMKQRLAIAATLLKDPDLLIFDEPTNGLDPAGIHEIRQTMRGLADQGKTVLVSSHILAEVQQVADTVSIIGRGRLLAEGRVTTSSAAAGERSPGRGGRPGLGGRLLRVAAGFAVEPARRVSCTSALGTARSTRPQINRFLAERGIYVRRAGARCRPTWSRSSWSSPPARHLGAQPGRHRRPAAARSRRGSGR